MRKFEYPATRNAYTRAGNSAPARERSSGFDQKSLGEDGGWVAWMAVAHRDSNADFGKQRCGTLYVPYLGNEPGARLGNRRVVVTNGAHRAIDVGGGERVDIRMYGHRELGGAHQQRQSDQAAA